MLSSQVVGKRVLASVKTKRYGDVVVSEYRVLEASPSGLWLKLQNIDGRKFWVALVDISLIEELQDIRAERLASKPEV